MSYQHNPLMEPEFFTPRGSKRLYKGGGGSSSYYGNLNKLYKEQAESARLLRRQAEQYLPGAVSDYVGRVKDITGADYADNQANLAAADMASANAAERDATERSLSSMGVNPSDPRFAGSMRGAEIGNAARMAAGKNLARNDAKKLQVAVAQDAVGTFTGQSNSAASQMGGASSGLANLAAQQNASKQAAAAQQSDSIANAVGGTMAAASMLGNWRDGGEIPRFAAGGAVWGKTPAPTGAAPLPRDTNNRMLARGLFAKLQGGQADAPQLSEQSVSASDLISEDGSLTLRPIERHMLGGTSGGQHGFFQMQQVAPPPAAPARPQSGGAANVMKAVNMARAGKSLATSAQNVGTKIEAMKAGANMTADQTAAARDAYHSAAAATKDPALAAKYENLGNKLETGNKWFGDAEPAAAAATDATTDAAASTATDAAAQGATDTAAQATTDAATSATTDAAASATTEAASQGATEAASSASGASGANPVTAALNAATRIANGQDATQAVSGAAGAYGGAQLGAMAGTAVGGPIGTVIGGAIGGIAGGLGVDMAFAADGGEIPSAAPSGMAWRDTAANVNSMLGAYKDGGEISPRDEYLRAWSDDAPAENGTQDLRDGAAVEGAGSHTDDIVPALLSAGEGVLNGEAMALGGKEIMEELNERGLALRKRGISPEQIRGMRGAMARNKGAQ